MSYEIISENQFKCPCGNGTYQVTISENDWFQRTEHWEMLCESCKPTYLALETVRYDSGMSRNSYRWISIEEYNKAKEIEKHCALLIQYLLDKYLDDFIVYFSEKPKKKIWEIITLGGKQYPSLGTFYRHTRDDGLDKYLRRYFEIETERAFEIIGKNPPELEELKKLKSNQRVDLTR